MQAPAEKIMSLGRLSAVRERLAAESQSFGLTNGCFDILHRGHVEYLWESSCLSDFLAVAINSDQSVQELKGPSRPVNTAADRAVVLAGLGFVDAVFVFSGCRLDEEIRQLTPDIYTKAGDYTYETLDPGERAALDQAGTKISFIPFTHGYSTTTSIERMKAAEK